MDLEDLTVFRCGAQQDLGREGEALGDQKVRQRQDICKRLRGIQFPLGDTAVNFNAQAWTVFGKRP